MSQITRAHHTGLTVRSLERSVAFYRDVLGFEEAFAWNPRARTSPSWSATRPSICTR